MAGRGGGVRPDYRARERTRKRLKAIAAPCAICGKQIDYELDWWTDPKDGKRKRHPLSFEYDHRVPVSISNDNSFDNAQPAHRICNQRKSNRVRSPQAREIPNSRAW